MSQISSLKLGFVWKKYILFLPVWRETKQKSKAQMKCSWKIREREGLTPRRNFAEGHALQFEHFWACSGILKPSRNNRRLNPNASTSGSPNQASEEECWSYNIGRVNSDTLRQQLGQRLHCLAGQPVTCWPVHLAVLIYILSDKSFWQMGILITQIQIFLLGLTSVSSLLAYPSSWLHWEVSSKAPLRILNSQNFIYRNASQIMATCARIT